MIDRCGLSCAVTLSLTVRSILRRLDGSGLTVERLEWRGGVRQRVLRIGLTRPAPRRRLSFDDHYLYDQSHRSLCLRAALHGGRARTRRYGGSATPPAHYTRRMELLRYFVISLTLSERLVPSERPGSSPTNITRDVSGRMISHSRVDRKKSQVPLKGSSSHICSTRSYI